MHCATATHHASRSWTSHTAAVTRVHTASFGPSFTACLAWSCALRPRSCCPLFRRAAALVRTKCDHVLTIIRSCATASGRGCSLCFPFLADGGSPSRYGILLPLSEALPSRLTNGPKSKILPSGHRNPAAAGGKAAHAPRTAESPQPR
jgi:hypothetical protein